MKNYYADHSYEAQQRKCHFFRITFRLIMFASIGGTSFSVNAVDGPDRNNAMHAFYPVDVTPHIEINGEIITSRLAFINRGQTPIQVMEGINGFGVRGVAARDPQPLMDNEFTVSTDGRELQYVGPVYKRMPYTKEYFSPMQPCEFIGVRYDRLDQAYEFIRGTHEYVIVHHHFEYDEKTGKIFRVDSRPAKFVYTRR